MDKKKKIQPKAKPKQVLTDQQAKCRECRECCEYVEFPVTMLSMDVIEYFQFRGEQFYINPANGVLSVRVFKPCVHLGKDGCMVYDTRPETCKAFMCHEKDKSVKAHKDLICKYSMDEIAEATNKFKEIKK